MQIERRLTEMRGAKTPETGLVEFTASAASTTGQMKE